MSLEDICRKNYPVIAASTTLISGWSAVDHSYFDQRFYSPLFTNLPFMFSSLFGAPFIFLLAINKHNNYKYNNPKDSSVYESLTETALKNKFSFMTAVNISAFLCFFLSGRKEFSTVHSHVNFISQTFPPLLASSFCNYYLSNIKQAKRPYLINYLRTVNLQIKFHKKISEQKWDDAKQIIELELKEISNVSDFMYTSLAQKYISSKDCNYEEFIKSVDLSIKALPNYYKNYYSHPVNIFLPFVENLLKKTNVICDDDFDSAFSNLGWLDFFNYFKKFDFLLQKNPNFGLIAIYCLTNDKLYENWSYVKDNISKRKMKNLRIYLSSQVEGDDIQQLLCSKVEKEWQRFTESLITKTDISKSLENIEGKKVYSIALYDFLKTMLTVKEGDKKYLESESNNLLFLKSRTTNVNFEAAVPLKIVELNENNYLIEKHSNGIRLTEFLQNKIDYDILLKVVQYLKFMHENLPCPDDKINPYVELKSKITALNISDSLKQDLYDGARITLKHLSKKRVFDCDAHSDNWFVSGEKIIAIDKPTRNGVPPEYDLNKLLNRGPEIKEKEKLVASYASDELFLFSFYNSSLIKALSYFVYSMHHSSKAHHAVNFLNNTSKDLDTLKHSYSEMYSRDEIHMLEKAQQIINSLADKI